MQRLPPRRALRPWRSGLLDFLLHAYDKDDDALNQGGGVVVGKEAVVTNCHVVEDGARIASYRARKDWAGTLTIAQQ